MGYNYCKKCGSEFYTKKGGKYCSLKCKSQSQRVADAQKRKHFQDFLKKNKSAGDNGLEKSEKDV